MTTLPIQLSRNGQNSRCFTSPWWSIKQQIWQLWVYQWWKIKKCSWKYKRKRTSVPCNKLFLRTDTTSSWYAISSTALGRLENRKKMRWNGWWGYHSTSSNQVWSHSLLFFHPRNRSFIFFWSRLRCRRPVLAPFASERTPFQKGFHLVRANYRYTRTLA